MSGLPDSESLESWGWDSIERLLIGSMAGLGYLVKSLPSTDSNKDAVGIAIQSAQTTTEEGDPPVTTTTTTGTLLASVVLPLESDALQEAGSLLKNVGHLTGANLTAGEICPPSPAGPALPTIPEDVDSLEKLFVWAALTLNASLYPEALTYIQISPAYGESLLSVSLNWPLDSETLALNGGNFVAAAQRLALTYAVLDGSAGSSGGVVLPPPVQYWGVPVADLSALGALLTQSPGMSRFVVSEGTFYTLLAELPDGESLDGLNFVAGQGSTVWRRVGEQGPAGPAGNDGSPGADGLDGVDGLSAYQIAVNNGFVGTEAHWLASLEGAQGPAGFPGAGLDWRGSWNVATSYFENDAVSYGGSSWVANTANTGKTPGVDPEWDLWVAKGEPGADGQDGLPGADGLDGADGLSAYQLAVNAGFIGTESEWLASLEGADGLDGADGLSAYQIAVNNGFIGTEAQWLASLEGAQGPAGLTGPPGPQGVRGYTGGLGFAESYFLNIIGIGANATVERTLTIPKSLLIYRIISSSSVRIRQYFSADYRTADLSRPSSTAIEGDHGCYYDVKTKAEKSFVRNLSPPPIAISTGTGYFSITNLESTSQDVNIQIIALTLEA